MIGEIVSWVGHEYARSRGARGCELILFGRRTECVCTFHGEDDERPDGVDAAFSNGAILRSGKKSDNIWVVLEEPLSKSEVEF